MCFCENVYAFSIVFILDHTFQENKTVKPQSRNELNIPQSLIDLAHSGPCIHHSHVQ